MPTHPGSDAADDEQLNQSGDFEALLNATLNEIVAEEPIQEDGTTGELSSPCVYCWQSGPLDGPTEGRHASDCEWIEARAASDRS